MTSPASTAPITAFSASEDVLIDEWVPGAPLLISFAFVNWEGPAEFYLSGRSRKLEEQYGRRFNRVLLRDRRNLWYLQGVPGFGASLMETVETLGGLIQAIAPSEVWCVGESMGGYAALLYGILLKADRILSFGPLSSFSADFAKAYGDLRWHDVMTRVDSTPADLPDLVRQSGYEGIIHLVAGTGAGPEAPDAVNLDVMHAERFAALPRVWRHYYPDAEHAVTKWLADHGRFDEILAHCLYDAPIEGVATLPPSVQDGETVPLLQERPGGFPLIIAFADDLVTAEEHAQLERLHGVSIQMLVVRGDVSIDAIRNHIEALAPSRVICIGSGLGGYAALAMGPRLGVHRILAINPLSVLDPDLAKLWHDRRYQPPPGPDLLSLLAQYPGKAYIACGTLGAGTGSDVGSHDAVHALRLGALPGVHVQPWPASVNLVHWMRDRKLLLGFIGYCGLRSAS